MRDFITTAQLPQTLAAFHVDATEANHFAGEICITYLNFSDFETALVKQEVKPEHDSAVGVNPLGLVSSALDQSDSSLAGLMVRLLAKAQRKEGRSHIVDFSPSTKTLHPASNLTDDHPFLKYATDHWAIHTSQFEEGKSLTWTSWWNIVTEGHKLVQPPWGPSWKDDAALTWSCANKHDTLLRRIVQSRVSYSEILGYVLGPLIGAGDSEEVFMLLLTDLLEGPLNKRSIVQIAHMLNIPTETRREALEAMVKIVTDLQDISSGWTVLHAASSVGAITAVEKLTPFMADFDKIRLSWRILIKSRKLERLRCIWHQMAAT